VLGILLTSIARGSKGARAKNQTGRRGGAQSWRTRWRSEVPVGNAMGGNTAAVRGGVGCRKRVGKKLGRGKLDAEIAPLSE